MYLFLISGCFDWFLNTNVKGDQVLLIYPIIIFTLRACKVILRPFCGAFDQNLFCCSDNSTTERQQNHKNVQGDFINKKKIIKSHQKSPNVMKSHLVNWNIFWWSFVISFSWFLLRVLCDTCQICAIDVRQSQGECPRNVKESQGLQIVCKTGDIKLNFTFSDIDSMAMSTVTALAEARQTSYIRGRWVYTENAGELQYSIVEPSLPGNGDYSAYNLWGNLILYFN